VGIFLFSKGEHTMIKMEHTIFINRPQQEVWDFISDPANRLHWVSGAESAEWASEGPPGVGSIGRSTAKFLGRKMESKSEITIWDPPNQHGLKSIGGPVPFEEIIKLESRENGTQLTSTSQMEVGGFFKMAEGLVRKQTEKAVVASAQALKRVLEEGQE
jgi:carbon monoxide dehydrogenase subunit G